MDYVTKYMGGMFVQEPGLTSTYASQQALGTYTWIAGTWWYHQKYFVHKKNALNLAFFSVFSLFAGVTLSSFMSKTTVHDEFFAAGM